MDEQSNQSNRVATSDRCCLKSPVTIQEWVDSISIDKREQDSLTLETRISRCKLDVDLLHLGAEAGQAKHSIKCVQYDASVRDRRASLIQMKEKSSLQSDVSSQSASSLSSIETLLESRREDPEQILLSLGFGGSSDCSDPLARIPKRFLKPSEVKGNDLDQFVRQQEELLEALDSGFCGYRGLSGFLRESQRPVGIVGKILDKIRADRSVSDSPTANLTSFSEVAFSVLAANSFRNALLRSAKRQMDSPGGSILEPANREFLEHQGRSAGNERRIVLGQDEFCEDGDGGLVHAGKVEQSVMPRRRTTSLVLLENEDNSSKSKYALWNVYKQLKSSRSECEEVSSSRRSSNEMILVRQNSICLDSNDFLMSQNQTEINRENDSQEMDTLPVSNDDKLSTYKESFELEELPSHGDENVQEDGDERRHSGLSDSSGFLDGETNELLQADENRTKISAENRLVRPEPLRLCPVDANYEEKVYDESEREDLVSKNTFRPINRDDSVPEFRLVVSDHDADVGREEEMPSLALESVEKECFRSEIQLRINSGQEIEESGTIAINDEDEDDGEEKMVNVSQDSLEMASCSNLSIVSRVAEVIKSEETDEEVPGKTRRRRSLVTTTVKTHELVVTPQMSPQISPRGSPNAAAQEEDEYYDLQRLLCVISGGEIQSKLSRQEFFSKPIKERTRVEAIALQMALKKYQHKLNNDQSSFLNRFKDSCDADQKDELMLLRDLHAGICKEVAQLQLLLKSRLQNATKTKFLPLSIRLIRQFSLLLHQQNFLCQQLERLKRQEVNNSDKTVEKYATQSPVVEDTRNQMQFTLDNFQDRLYTDLQQTFHEENADLKKELREIKSLLKQLLSKHETNRNSGEKSQNAIC